MEYSKVGLRWGSKSNWISPSVMIQQPCLADASIACKLTSHLMFQRKKNCWRTAVRITVMHKYDSAECFWVVSFFYVHIYWIIFVDLKWGKTPRLLLLCTCSWSTSFLQVFFLPIIWMSPHILIALLAAVILYYFCPIPEAPVDVLTF